MKYLYTIDVCEPGCTMARSVRISGKVIRVGRSAICEVSLRGTGLSGVECLVRYDRGAWLICPFGHVPRTRVGGALIERPTVIAPGEPFFVGEIELRVHAIECEHADVAPGSRQAPLEARAVRAAHGTPAARLAAHDKVDAKRPELAPPAPPSIPETSPLRAQRAGFAKRNVGSRLAQPASTPVQGSGMAALKSDQGWNRPVPVASPPTRSRYPMPGPTRDRDVPAQPTMSAAPPAAARAAPVWIDQEELAGRSAWEASDWQFPEDSTISGPVTEPQRTLVEHDFALPEGLSARVAECGVTAEPIESPGPLNAEVTVEQGVEAVEVATPPVAPVGAVASQPPDLPTPASQWPSARMILEAHESVPRAATNQAERRARVRPHPSPHQRPSGWTLPGRGVLSILLGATLIGSGGGVAWSGLCAWDNADAGADFARIARGEPRSMPSQPGRPWWVTTAAHLYLAAAASDTGDPGAHQTEAARAELARALALCPVDPSIQHALLGLDSTQPAAAPYPSHDIYRLVDAARARFAAGQTDRAREHLRDAYQLAVSAMLGTATAPALDSQAGPGRAHLPNEDLFGPMTELLAEQSNRELPALSDVVPPYAPAWLSVARRWRAENHVASRAIIAHLVALPHEAPEGGSTALQRAAIAEGLAMEGSYTDAARLYESAVACADALAWKGLLWFNLSELYTRLHERDRAAAARHAAQRGARGEGTAALAIKQMIQATTMDGARAPQG